MTSGAETISSEETRAHAAIAALRAVIDPELGIDIVSLGLLYRVTVDADDVCILMTLTVPGCPMHDTIVGDVRNTLERLPWVKTASVELTFDPPWSVERLSDDARRALGRA